MIGRALLLLLAAAAGPAQQFDLVCTGERRFQLLDQPQPVTFRLRVDLAAKLWCEDQPPPPGQQPAPCPAVRPIAEVQPTFIAFEQESAEDKARGFSNARLVNRQTGKYLRYVDDARPSVIAVAATCRPAAFSGFPTPPTKF